jgi:hypothetical protein
MINQPIPTASFELNQHQVSKHQSDMDVVHHKRDLIAEKV